MTTIKLMRYGSNHRASAIFRKVINSSLFVLFLITSIHSVLAQEGTIVVLRAGDGSALLTNNSTACYLEYFSTVNGSRTQTLALPQFANGTNAPLTISGSATSEGFLLRSSGKQFLTLAGYAVPPGTTSVSNTSGATVKRVIGIVDAAGNVNTSSQMTAGFSGTNIRSAIASDDGNQVWASGALGGVFLINKGEVGPGTQIASTPTNTRVLNIIDGQLYVSTAQAVFTVGSGLPNTGGQSATNFLSTSPTASTYAFVGFDLNPSIPGIDALYVADDRSIGSGGGLQRWDYTGTAWTLSYTLTAGLSGGLRGLAGEVLSSIPVLYATTANASAVVKIKDTGVSSSFSTLAAAPPNTVFRGIAFAPSNLKTDQTISFGSLPNENFGDAPFSLTATASSGLTVSYSSSNTNVATVSGSTVTIVGVGTTTITASQSGNNNYNAASDVSQTFTVNKADQSITFNSPASKNYGDAPFSLDATASSALTVSYSSSNTNVATISGSTVTMVGAGSTTITASQPGNDNFNAATDVTQTLTVNKIDQAITFNSLTSKNYGESPFTLDATASSGLPISYASGSTNVATVSGNTVTIVGAGSTTITASQSGNDNFNAATDITQTLTVNKIDQAITFNSLTSKKYGDAPFTLTATASSGLTVSYSSSNTTVATISNNTLTIVGAGITTITASQQGNDNFNAAFDVPQTLTVTNEPISLVKDINQQVVSSNPAYFLDVNGVAYFSANDASHGVELWKLDQQNKPVFIKDINPGTGGSSPSNFINVNGTVFFLATNSSGQELWKTDGTAGGTTMVRDINSGSASSVINSLTNVNGILYFSAASTTQTNTYCCGFFCSSTCTSSDPANYELWKSDGTFGGTMQVKDINPGIASSSPGNLINLNGSLYFYANDGTGSALWVSDGTLSGTIKVKNFSVGVSWVRSAVINNRIFFSASDGVHGYELWQSDGTADGTTLVKDIYPGSADAGLNYLTNVNGTLFFIANDGINGAELWKSDGTEAGTVMVKDIYSGSNGSSPNLLSNIGGTLYFLASDGIFGGELWKSDGTPSGTYMVKDIFPGTNSGASNFCEGPNGTVILNANDGVNGFELWQSDGTAGGTVMVKDIWQGANGSYPYYLIFFSGGHVLFNANDGINGNQLWTTDGTTQGTTMIKLGISRDGAVANVTKSGITIYFTANDGLNGNELWKTDGTTAGTSMVKDIYPGGANFNSNPFNLTDINGVLYFTANDGTHGNELWKTDGTTEGTVMVADIIPGLTSSNISNLTNVNGILYFSAASSVQSFGFNNFQLVDYELWKSDGTPGGTVLVKDIYPGTNSSSPSSLTVANGILYFVANDGTHGPELWKSDGTDAGTVMVSDIYPGANGSSISYLTATDDALYFSAYNGSGLWKVDLSSGVASSIPMMAGTGSVSNIVRVGNLVYFSASSSSGNELWRSDGTSAGTYQVKDIYPGSVGSSPYKLASLNGILLFTALDPTGWALWRSDGTSDGTHKMFDGSWGISALTLNPLANENGTMFFTASDNQGISRLWSTNGTACGTTQMTTPDEPDLIVNGKGAILNNLLYFSYNSSRFGAELFKAYIQQPVCLPNTITFPPLSQKTYGDPAFTLNATASDGTSLVAVAAITYTSSNSLVAQVNGNVLTILAAGTTTITAHQYGDPTHAAAADVSQILTVNKANQTITFNSLPPKNYGDPAFVLNAGVSSNLPISFFSSNINVARISGNTVIIVGAGTSTITATQSGNNNYNAAANVNQVLIVNKANQTITFNLLPPKNYGDGLFAPNATATSGLLVGYSSSNTNVARISGSLVTIVGAGTTTITAFQSGNFNYNAATNVQQVLTVNKANQTITFNPLPPKNYGSFPFALNAITSSGLAVVYTSSDANIATVNGNIVTIMGGGIATITASQPGNNNYNAALDAPQLLTVSKADQTISFDALAATTFGAAPIVLSATGGASGNAVTFTSSDPTVATVDGNTLTIVRAGTTTITASQPGNNNYNAATDVQQTLTVNQASQVITFDALAATTYGDVPIVLSATGGASGNAVTFTSSDPTVATVDGNTLTIVGAGTTTITASQAGNNNYNAAADVQQTLTVNQASQTITFDAIAATTYGDVPIVLSATGGASGNAVTFTSSDLTVATVNGSTLTIVGAGTTTITASQAGSRNYIAAPDVQQTLTVNQASQTITFDALAATTYGDAPFTLAATTSSGLPVSYSSSDTSVATVSGSTVTIMGAGITIITAFQTGNASYSAASGVQQTLIVNQATQTLTLNALPVMVVGDAVVNPAMASSNLTITYKSSNLAVATVTGGVMNAIGAGTTIITASQTGDANYLPATDVQQTLTVVNPTYIINPKDGATGQSISLTVTAQTQTGATTYTIDLSPTSNFSNGLISMSGSRSQNFSGLSYNTIYYARVKTDLSPAYGKTTSFTTVDPLSLTYVTSPKNGGKNVATSVTVSSNIVPGATTYTIELNTDARFLNGVSFKNSSSSNSILFTGLANNTTYYTRVQTDVAPGQWGTSTSFTTATPNKKNAVARQAAEGDTQLEDSMNVYPLPFRNKLMVQISSDETESIAIHLYDLNGKETVRYEGETNALIELETGELSPGMYILKSLTTAGPVFKKVIKE